MQVVGYQHASETYAVLGMNRLEHVLFVTNKSRVCLRSVLVHGVRQAAMCATRNILITSDFRLGYFSAYIPRPFITLYEANQTHFTVAVMVRDLTDRGLY